jgi:hypothetical protein
MRPLLHEPALEAARDRGEPGEARRRETPQHARLPGGIEAFDVGVTARLALRDEAHLDPQEHGQPDGLGDGSADEAADGDLVVEMPDPRQPQAGPGDGDQVVTEALGALVGTLPGRDAAAADVDGVEGIEAQRARRRAQVTRTDQIGLLQITGPLGTRRGICPAGAFVRDRRSG